MLEHLPPELVIQTLSYLQLGSLTALHQLSRQWNEFIITNGTLIYYNAAVVHSFVNSLEQTPSSLNEALKRHGGRFWRGITSWREFCGHTFTLEYIQVPKGLDTRQTTLPAGEQLGRTGAIGLPEYIARER